MEIEGVDENENKKSSFCIKADSYQKSMLDYVYTKQLKRRERQASESSLNSGDLDAIVKNLSELTIAPRQAKSSFRFFDAKNQIEFEIKRGDLLKERVDAVVNAANCHLNLGGQF